MSTANRSIGARSLVEARCVDPCHKPVGGNEGSRCPPGDHCGCNGMRQCSKSGYCFGTEGHCIERPRSFIQASDSQVVVSVFSGFSCCNATLGRSARGTEQRADSLERCLMLCTAAQWCAAAEWSPAEVLNCFLMIHPDSHDDLDGLFGAQHRQGRRLCMRTSWNSTLTAGGIESTAAGQEQENDFLETNLTVCGANVTLAQEKSQTGGGGPVPVYGKSEDECEGGAWLCTKDTLAVCLPFHVAEQFSDQHGWNCTEVMEKPTTTTTETTQAVVEEGSSALVWWILGGLLLLCSLGCLIFCFRRRSRKRRALHMLPTNSSYSDLGRVRSTSKSSIFSQRSLSNVASFIRTGSTRSIQDASPKFPGHHRKEWSQSKANSFASERGKVPPLQSSNSGCGFPGTGVLKGGWGRGAERPETRVGKDGGVTHVWAVHMPSFPGLRGAANAPQRQDDVFFMGATWSYGPSAPGTPHTPGTPQTPGSWGTPMQRPATSPPGSSRSSRSAPAAVHEFQDPPRPNTATRAAAAFGNMAAEFSAWTAQMRQNLNSRSGSRSGFRESPTSREQDQQPRKPEERRESRGRSSTQSGAAGARPRTAPSTENWDNPDEESSEEQPPIRRAQSSPGYRHDDVRGRRMSRDPPRQSQSSTSLPATLRFADLRIDATTPEMADAMLERKVDKLLWRLRSMTPRRHRNRVFLEQCRAWHPDKNTGEERLATVAFQRLQASRSWFLSDVDTDNTFVITPSH